MGPKKEKLQAPEDAFGYLQGTSNKKQKEERKATEAKVKASRLNRRDEPKVTTSKKVLGIVAICFMCGVGFLQFLSAVFGFFGSGGITYLDIKDTTKLKSVLFGGDPWFVYCVNNQTVNHQLPKVVEDSTYDLWRNLGTQIAVLSCWDNTESGRSIAQKYKMRDSPPLAFLVANGDKPRVVNLVGVSKPADLEKKLEKGIKVETKRIGKLKEWSSLCTSRRSCLVVGHKNTAQRDTAMNVVKPYVEKFRAVRVVTLDTAFWQLKLPDSILKTRPARTDGAPKKAEVLCIARNEGGDKNNSHSGIFLDELESSNVKALFKACDQREGLVPIGKSPTIMARPSKPKTVKAEPLPTPSPPKEKKSSPPPTPPPKGGKKSTGKVDHVGSRAEMERQAEEEALFEAVDPEEVGAEEDAEEGEGDDEDVEDVEL
eukprot:gnl/TRDRNA2_/TRDRNA2_36874_c0_seq1.p1 gnl/TRDRNA2_/TRDRNA2_36874_c0~~gnl/TRDRNA2_/TRDRNA2_36874_c0_seq1.p1  ORF type:complete len:428 (+),score=103.91 gnl/TRDRNA2_/TRDRNA2_36874_c0_seq1:88-1371(+)